MTVHDLVRVIETIAPPAFAAEWDNVGLLLGDASSPLAGPVILTIDLTPAVAREALDARASAVIAYHPPIFRPIARLTASNPMSAALLGLAGGGVAVYSPHTALDAAPGGLTDWLLDQAATDDATPMGGAPAARLPLEPHVHRDLNQTHKLVTFVPAASLDVLRDALADAGAGVINEYERCSFSAAGRGSFQGSARTNPAVGHAGRLEFVEEQRLEMICPARRLPEILAALRRTHPYEEPAFDLFERAATPDPHAGAGRIVTLDAPTSLGTIAARLKRRLGVHAVAHGGPDRVTRIAAVPGSGASLLGAALSAGADCFITGEMKHHEALAAIDAGCAVLLAGHTETERPYLPVLASRLASLLTGIDARPSRADAPPLRIG